MILCGTASLTMYRPIHHPILTDARTHPIPGSSALETSGMEDRLKYNAPT
jgi:hypothetical protein